MNTCSEGAKTVGLGFLSDHSRVERNEHPHIYCFNISYPLVGLDPLRDGRKALSAFMPVTTWGWELLLYHEVGLCRTDPGAVVGAGAYYTPDGSGGGRLLVGRRMSKNARCSFPAFSISR